MVRYLLGHQTRTRLLEDPSEVHIVEGVGAEEEDVGAVIGIVVEEAGDSTAMTVLTIASPAAIPRTVDMDGNQMFEITESLGTRSSLGTFEMIARWEETGSTISFDRNRSTAYPTTRLQQKTSRLLPLRLQPPPLAQSRAAHPPRRTFSQ